METPVLSDPDIYPTDKVIAACLSKANAAFISLFEYNHTNFPEFAERWRYYNDGKQWLMNVSRKKKTVFWLHVSKGFFRTSFYLAPKFETMIAGSDLPASLKKQYKASAGASFRPITIVIKTKKDAEVFKKALALKLTTM